MLKHAIEQQPDYSNASTREENLEEAKEQEEDSGDFSAPPPSAGPTSSSPQVTPSSAEKFRRDLQAWIPEWLEFNYRGRNEQVFSNEQFDALVSLLSKYTVSHDEFDEASAMVQVIKAVAERLKEAQTILWKNSQGDRPDEQRDALSGWRSDTATSLNTAVKALLDSMEAYHRMAKEFQQIKHAIEVETNLDQKVGKEGETKGQLLAQALGETQEAMLKNFKQAAKQGMKAAAKSLHEAAYHIEETIGPGTLDLLSFRSNQARGILSGVIMLEASSKHLKKSLEKIKPDTKTVKAVADSVAIVLGAWAQDIKKKFHTLDNRLEAYAKKEKERHTEAFPKKGPLLHEAAEPFLIIDKWQSKGTNKTKDIAHVLAARMRKTGSVVSRHLQSKKQGKGIAPRQVEPEALINEALGTVCLELLNEVHILRDGAQKLMQSAKQAKKAKKMLPAAYTQPIEETQEIAALEAELDQELEQARGTDVPADSETRMQQAEGMQAMLGLQGKAEQLIQFAESAEWQTDPYVLAGHQNAALESLSQPLQDTAKKRLQACRPQFEAALQSTRHIAKNLKSVGQKAQREGADLGEVQSLLVLAWSTLDEVEEKIKSVMTDMTGTSFGLHAQKWRLAKGMGQKIYELEESYLENPVTLSAIEEIWREEIQSTFASREDPHGLILTKMVQMAIDDTALDRLAVPDTPEELLAKFDSFATYITKWGEKRLSRRVVQGIFYSVMMEVGSLLASSITMNPLRRLGTLLITAVKAYAEWKQKDTLLNGLMPGRDLFHGTTQTFAQRFKQKLAFRVLNIFLPNAARDGIALGAIAYGLYKDKEDYRKDFFKRLKSRVKEDIAFEVLFSGIQLTQRRIARDAQTAINASQIGAHRPYLEKELLKPLDINFQPLESSDIPANPPQAGATTGPETSLGEDLVEAFGHFGPAKVHEENATSTTKLSNAPGAVHATASAPTSKSLPPDAALQRARGELLTRNRRQTYVQHRHPERMVSMPLQSKVTTNNRENLDDEMMQGDQASSSSGQSREISTDYAEDIKKTIPFLRESLDLNKNPNIKTRQQAIRPVVSKLVREIDPSQIRKFRANSADGPLAERGLFKIHELFIQIGAYFIALDNVRKNLTTKNIDTINSIKNKVDAIIEKMQNVSTYEQISSIAQEVDAVLNEAQDPNFMVNKFINTFKGFANFLDSAEDFNSQEYTDISSNISEISEYKNSIQNIEDRNKLDKLIELYEDIFKFGGKANKLHTMSMVYTNNEINNIPNRIKQIIEKIEDASTYDQISSIRPLLNSLIDEIDKKDISIFPRRFSNNLQKFSIWLRNNITNGKDFKIEADAVTSEIMLIEYYKYHIDDTNFSEQLNKLGILYRNIYKLGKKINILHTLNIVYPGELDGVLRRAGDVMEAIKNLSTYNDMDPVNTNLNNLLNDIDNKHVNFESDISEKIDQEIDASLQILQTTPINFSIENIYKIIISVQERIINDASKNEKEKLVASEIIHSIHKRTADLENQKRAFEESDGKKGIIYAFSEAQLHGIEEGKRIRQDSTKILTAENLRSKELIYSYTNSNGETVYAATTLLAYISRKAQGFTNILTSRAPIHIIWPREFSSELIAYIDGAADKVDKFSRIYDAHEEIKIITKDFSKDIPSVDMYVNKILTSLNRKYNIEGGINLSDTVTFNYTTRFIDNGAISFIPGRIKFTIAEILFGWKKNWEVNNTDATRLVPSSQKYNNNFLSELEQKSTDLESAYTQKITQAKNNTEIRGKVSQYIDQVLLIHKPDNATTYKVKDAAGLYIFTSNADKSQNSSLNSNTGPIKITSLIFNKSKEFSSIKAMKAALATDSQLKEWIIAHFSYENQNINLEETLQNITANKEDAHSNNIAIHILDKLIQNMDQMVKSPQENAQEKKWTLISKAASTTTSGISSIFAIFIVPSLISTGIGVVFEGAATAGKIINSDMNIERENHLFDGITAVAAEVLGEGVGAVLGYGVRISAGPITSQFKRNLLARDMKKTSQSAESITSSTNRTQQANQNPDPLQGGETVRRNNQVNEPNVENIPSSSHNASTANGTTESTFPKRTATNFKEGVRSTLGLSSPKGKTKLSDTGPEYEYTTMNSTWSKLSGAQSGKGEVMQINLGKDMYLFREKDISKNRQGKTPKRLIISVHGAYISSGTGGTPAVLPTGTKMVFLGPHGSSLKNPGLKEAMVTRPNHPDGIVPFAVVEQDPVTRNMHITYESPGAEALTSTGASNFFGTNKKTTILGGTNGGIPDYTLSKYQTKGDETYADIANSTTLSYSGGQYIPSDFLTIRQERITSRGAGASDIRGFREGDNTVQLKEVFEELNKAGLEYDEIVFVGCRTTGNELPIPSWSTMQSETISGIHPNDTYTDLLPNNQPESGKSNPVTAFFYALVNSTPQS